MMALVNTLIFLKTHSQAKMAPDTVRPVHRPALQGSCARTDGDRLANPA